MKKNTVAKFMLAGTALAVAFACQSKSKLDNTNEDELACKETCAVSVVTAAEANKTTETITIENAVENDKDVYVIEISDVDATPSEAVAEAPKEKEADLSVNNDLDVASTLGSANQTKSAAKTKNESPTKDDAHQHSETNKTTTTTKTNNGTNLKTEKTQTNKSTPNSSTRTTKTRSTDTSADDGM